MPFKILLTLHEKDCEQDRYLPTSLRPNSTYVRGPASLRLSRIRIIFSKSGITACLWPFSSPVRQTGLTMPVQKVISAMQRYDIDWAYSSPRENHCLSSKLLVTSSLGRTVSGNFPSHIAYTFANDTDHYVIVQSCGRASYTPSARSKGF